MKLIILLLLGSSIFITACQRQPVVVPVVEPTPVASSTIQEYSFTATESGVSAYDLLMSSAAVESENYDFGSFVTKINGVAAPENKFWALYINNEKAQSGASDIILQKDDIMTWKIESIQ